MKEYYGYIQGNQNRWFKLELRLKFVIYVEFFPSAFHIFKTDLLGLIAMKIRN